MPYLLEQLFVKEISIFLVVIFCLKFRIKVTNLLIKYTFFI